MMADEAEANFDELDLHEEDDESSGLEEDDKVTPWASITDDGKTPDGLGMTMKKIEDEVMMVTIGFDQNVMAYRKYGDEMNYTTDRGSEKQSFLANLPFRKSR